MAPPNRRGVGVEMLAVVAVMLAAIAAVQAAPVSSQQPSMRDVPYEEIGARMRSRVCSRPHAIHACMHATHACMHACVSGLTKCTESRE
jgi:hypothetical protein